MANKMFPQRHMTYIAQTKNTNDDAYAQSVRENIYTFRKKYSCGYIQYSACAPHPRRQESRDFSGILTWKMAYSGIFWGQGNYKFYKK